jgi:hypothetical protein
MQLWSLRAKSRKMPEPFPVRVVRYTMILAAIAAAPFYGLWIFGGWIADRRAQDAQANRS